jgi:ATP-binding cassette, subfamily B, bacterial
MVTLVLTSLFGGVLEALFLVVATRIAFSVTEGDQQVGLVAGRSVTMSSAISLSAALVVVRVGFAAAASWQSARMGSVVIADLRGRLGRAFLRSTWAVQHGERSGRLQELLTSFSQRGADLLHSVMQSVTAGSILLALLASAFLVDPLASLALIVAIGLLAIALRPLRVTVRREARSAAATGMDFATSLSEVSQLGMEAHVFNVQPQIESRVTRLIAMNEAATRRLNFVSDMVSVLYSGVVYLALIGGLVAVASIGEASIASVGGVMLVMLRSLTYGSALQAHTAAINSALPFIDSLHQELDRFEAARLVDHGLPIGRIGCLSVANVNFEYTKGVAVLRSIDLRIEPREVVGVVGPSGSGKSTLVQLLLALRDPTEGAVLSDGRDIRTLSKAEWARLVTFVPQQAHLIAGTISDNIRFLRDNVTQADIEHAAKLANLHDDVTRFAKGYEHQVGEQGSHLSGGQQQRLIIARALVEDPDVLILDEPTSALDVRSEHLIRRTLHDLRDRMTILIIAHRLSTLSICDRIMVIQDGELKGFDTPENLERSSDFYREALELSGLR